MPEARAAETQPEPQSYRQIAAIDKRHEARHRELFL